MDKYQAPLLQKFKEQVESREEKTEGEEGGASFAKTCFNGLNALSGVGLLSIPYALSQGGWLSLILLFIVSIICCYTGLLLQRCMDTNPNIRTYPQIGQQAFGRTGKLLVSIFMYLELYLVAIGFLILEGDNLDNLFPNTRVKIFNKSFEGNQFFVIIVAIVILPTTWLRRLDLLAFISASGVLASVIVVICVFWSAIFDVGFGGKWRWINFEGLPTSLGLYTFCYCGHAIFPTLCTSMKEKNKFSKVMVLCFFLCSLNYASMAILGYLMYGEDVQSQVTLNLPVGKLSSRLAIYTTLINPFSKFALMVTPIANAIEDRLLLGNKRSISVLVRTIVVLTTVIIALWVPFFGYLMALVGSFLSVIVSFLLPCICYLKIFGVGRCSKVELVIICGILVLGLLVAITGTYSSIMQIVREF